MAFNSKIYLRGEHEPIFCSEAIANQAKRMLEDASIPPTQVVSMLGRTFHKEIIRRVDVMSDSGQQAARPHWVIRNTVNGDIWKDVFTSYQEAEVELKFQKNMGKDLPHIVIEKM